MKDRIKRTDSKKVNHRLRNAFIAVCSVSLVSSAILFASISQLRKDNTEINARLADYTEEINQSEEQSNNLLVNHK